MGCILRVTKALSAGVDQFLFHDIGLKEVHVRYFLSDGERHFQPIDSSNKGFAMLQMMGYKPGMSLGKQGTIVGLLFTHVSYNIPYLLPAIKAVDFTFYHVYVTFTACSLCMCCALSLK